MYAAIVLLRWLVSLPGRCDGDLMSTREQLMRQLLREARRSAN